MSYLSDLLGFAYKEGMTEDEISSALEAAKKASDAENNRLKAQLSKANSEAADFKRQLREKQTKDEQAADEQRERLEKLEQDNEALRRSISLSERKAKLMSMGYSEDLAQQTATAMVDGDMDVVMANQAQYLENQKKVIESDLMRKTARPPAGSEGTGNLDYNKKIEEAQASGDFVAVSYYTRLQAQAATDHT